MLWQMISRLAGPGSVQCVTLLLDLGDGEERGGGGAGDAALLAGATVRWRGADGLFDI